MRYLIVVQESQVIAEPGDPAGVRRRDLDVATELQVGDELFLDEILMRIWSVVGVPTKAGHDGIAICRAAG